MRGSLGKLIAGSLSIAGRWQNQQLRRLNIHEYQGAELMSKYGINVPKGVAVASIEELKETIKSVFPNEKEIVVKSQILAGGRGLGTFKSGLKGGVHIVKTEEVPDIAEKMLGQILVTKQTGPQGKIVSKVYLCEKLSLVNEMYFAITLDRSTAGPLIIACKKGGTSIEDLAEKFPDMIIKVPIDVFKGITDEDAAKVVDGLAPTVADRSASIEQVKKPKYHHSGKSMMRLLYRCGILVVVLLLGSILLRVSSNHDDYFRCESIVRKWADYSNQNEIKENDLNLKDLLLFLHVPRTGGRTYFHCFLRKLYASALECPRSYDKLHFDPSKPNCRLLVTHDDYSLMSKLPKDRTSVVTILRDPVDRVFSTYEFSVEVAARFLIHPNLTSVNQMSRQIHKKTGGVSTLDIWPWKYLVPWMRQDLFNRRDTRRSGRYPKFEEISSPYDMQNMAMPLHEYINHPIAHDIIHNGATFQVAGLTNNSCSVESYDVHNCVKKHPQLGLFVLEVAKHRLNHMLYVGLTEEHKMSATMFAKLVGAQVLSQLENLNFDVEQAATNESEASSSFPDPEVNESNQVEDNKDPKENEDHSVLHPELARQNMTVETLINTYEKCVSSLRKSQATRRTTSLKRITPVAFSKQARLSVPKKTLKKIQDLNSLDVELYKHAQIIFLQQKKHLIQNAEDALLQQKGDLLAETELQTIGCGNFYGCSSWIFLIIPFFIIIVVILFVRKRRDNKLKI